MAVKHIPDESWRRIEEKTVEAIIYTKSHIKNTDMLKLLINIGLMNIKESDYQKLIKK